MGLLAGLGGRLMFVWFLEMINTDFYLMFGWSKCITSEAILTFVMKCLLFFESKHHHNSGVMSLVM